MGVHARAWPWLLALLAGACSRQAAPDEPVGVPSQPALTPLVAAEQGDGPRAVTLLPLEVGNTWTYEVTGSNGVCTVGEHTRAILREDDVTGHRAFFSTGFCGQDEATVFSPDGGQLLEYRDGEWRTALASTLAEGRAWDYTSEVSYYWHRIGWVRVAAGTFPNCWERLPRDNTWSQIFCDGVGMVSMSGNALLVELKSYSLNHGTRVSGGDDGAADAAQDPG